MTTNPMAPGIAAAQRGFTYLAVLALVVLMGVGSARVGEDLHGAEMREREQELLFVGDQYRRAIGRFYEQSPGRAKRYPRSIDELLADPRFPAVRRHLRKAYADPVTRSAEWGFVQGPGGEIMGVHSLSQAEPLKKTNFSAADRAFEGRGRYADWVFYYAPGQNPGTTPGQRSPNPGARTGLTNR